MSSPVSVGALLEAATHTQKHLSFQQEFIHPSILLFLSASSGSCRRRKMAFYTTTRLGLDETEVTVFGHDGVCVCLCLRGSLLVFVFTFFICFNDGFWSPGFTNTLGWI